MSGATRRSSDVFDVSEVDSTPLDLDDLFDVQSELTPVSAKWRSIGIALRLKPNILDGIQAGNSGDPPACLTSVVTEWLNRNYNVKRFGEPTWQTLVKAVGHPAGGANMALARDIAKKHIAQAAQRISGPTHTYAKGCPVELQWQMWFHAGITREKAEQRLEHATNGCFLVRESETKPGCFALSLRYSGGVIHFTVEKRESGLYELSGTHKNFTSISDLIAYFQCRPISEDPYYQLISPCNRTLHVVEQYEDTPPPMISAITTPPVPFPQHRLTSRKHTANTTFKGKPSLKMEAQQSSDVIQLQPHSTDNKSLLLHPHSRLSWKRVADLPVEMTQHHVVRIGSTIYCGGGHTDSVDTARLVFQYNPNQDTWSQLPICPTRCSGLTQLDGKLVTLGGCRIDQIIPINDVYIFQDFETWENSIIPPMTTARFYPTAFEYKSTVVVSGGVTHWETNSKNSTRTNAVEVFQTKTYKWYCAEPLALPHSNMSCAIIHDTCYLIGGTRSGGYASRHTYCTSLSNLITQALSLDNLESDSLPQGPPSPPTWQVLPECPLHYSTVTQLGCCLLAIGGRYDSNSPSSAVHMYSPSTNSWVRISSGDLPVLRFYAAATQLEGGEVITVGGYDESNSPTKFVFIASTLIGEYIV